MDQLRNVAALTLKPATRIKIALPLMVCWAIAAWAYFWIVGQPAHIVWSPNWNFMQKTIFLTIAVAFVWSAFQVFDVLVGGLLKGEQPLWKKVIWLPVLLVWPIGPVAYYLVEYNDRSQ